MVEPLELLTEDEVLQQGRSTATGLETVLVGDRGPKVGSHVATSVIDIESVVNGLFRDLNGIASIVLLLSETHFTRQVGALSPSDTSNSWQKPKMTHGGGNEDEKNSECWDLPRSLIKGSPLGSLYRLPWRGR